MVPWLGDFDFGRGDDRRKQARTFVCSAALHGSEWGGELAARLEAALAGLNPRERLVFELKHYEGLKLKAIGDILATSEETAKNSLFRATRKLRAALADLRAAAPALSAPRPEPGTMPEEV